MILDARRYLAERFPLDEASSLKVFENLGKCLGTYSFELPLQLIEPHDSIVAKLGKQAKCPLLTYDIDEPFAGTRTNTAWFSFYQPNQRVTKLRNRNLIA